MLPLLLFPENVLTVPVGLIFQTISHCSTKGVAPLILSRFRLVASVFLASVAAVGAAFVHNGSWQAASSELPASFVAAPAPVAAPRSTVATASTRFAPNYATELLNLRRWQKDSLTIFVEQPAPAQDSTHRDYAADVRSGAALWSPYFGESVALRFTENAAEADVRVSFVNHGSLPDGAIGRTEVTYRNRDNVIVAATVRLDRSLKADMLAQVAAHEMGHAMGMEGHSVDKTDLMYARAHLPGAITTRDANTLHLNYSRVATRANARAAAQADTPDVASTGNGTTTTAACSLPEAQ